MKIAIIGRTQLLYDTALKLHESGYEIGAVITAKAAPEYTRKEADFQRLASSLGAPFLLTNTLNTPEVEELCKGLDVGVSVNWVSLILPAQIGLFRLGILNVHCGDLPAYRGNACPNWAIINGELRITNTVHLMEGGKLDCGRVMFQQHFELDENTSITEVYEWLEETTPGLFVDALAKLRENRDYSLKYADADSPASFRCYPRLPEDSFIDWSQAAVRVHNLIRAVCHPFTGAYTYHWEKPEIKKLHVFKSRVVQRETKDLAAPGQVLRNDKENGESQIQCGVGIIALLECRYADESHTFLPGRRWKSIRMRLGIKAEDWLWQIYQNNNRQK